RARLEGLDGAADRAGRARLHERLPAVLPGEECARARRRAEDLRVVRGERSREGLASGGRFRLDARGNERAPEHLEEPAVGRIAERLARGELVLGPRLEVVLRRERDRLVLGVPRLD